MQCPARPPQKSSADRALYIPYPLAPVEARCILFRARPSAVSRSQAFMSFFEPPLERNPLIRSLQIRRADKSRGSSQTRSFSEAVQKGTSGTISAWQSLTQDELLVLAMPYNYANITAEQYWQAPNHNKPCGFLPSFKYFVGP